MSAAAAKSKLDEAFAALELEPGASEDEVKKAYKRLALKVC